MFLPILIDNVSGSWYEQDTDDVNLILF